MTHTAWKLFVFGGVAWMIAPLVLGADEIITSPKPIPQTRPEVKQALEALKLRSPRLPLPPPTQEELRRAKERSEQRPARKSERTASGLGSGIVNNGRMRSLYLPVELTTGGSSRSSDPRMTLDYPFTVELFWIASRVNNCHYCLGHQEAKLLAAGHDEPRIAALDCDWSRFTDKERAAYAFARKLTHEPQNIADADLAALGIHYTPLEVLEIAFHVARYNSTNRWTDSLGIPQEEHRTFLTSTPEEFATTKSMVALTAPPPARELSDRTATFAALEACTARTPRLPLATAAETIKVLELPAEVHPTHYQRLLANFPVAGKSQAQSLAVAIEKSKLPPKLLAAIAWTAARQDRAWYALGLARTRLHSLGFDDDAIFALDEFEMLPTEEERAALAFAAKLTGTPQAIADADVARLKKAYTPNEVAEIVHHVCLAAFFNRLTEASGLTLDN